MRTVQLDGGDNADWIKTVARRHKIGWMFRCAVCGAVKRVDFKCSIPVTKRLDDRRRRVAGAPSYVDAEGRQHAQPPRELLPVCCGKVMRGRAILAKPAKATACTAACRTAVSHACTCPCAGRNHGEQHR